MTIERDRMKDARIANWDGERVAAVGAGRRPYRAENFCTVLQKNVVKYCNVMQYLTGFLIILCRVI